MREAGGFGALALKTILVVGTLGALAVTLGLYVHFGFGILSGVSSDSMDSHHDFDVFWHSAKALWDGKNIYYDTGGPDNSNNPPLWTALSSPLGLLDTLTAYRVFVLITLLMSIVSLAWMADELRLRAKWAIIGVGMLLLSSPLIGTLAQGQMYSILALGLVAAWVADCRGKPRISGIILGLVVAIKPLLMPVILWPVMRKRWSMVGATLVSGAAATFIGVVVVGPRAMLDWLRVLDSERLNGFWDNASLHAGAARLFRENEFVEPIATLPWTEPAAYTLGIGIVVLTVARVRQDSEMCLWALVAASLLASPVAWHSYLMLLGPGILLLLARGWIAPALLLLALQSIPPDWSLPWRYGDTNVAALALTFNLYILTAHWLTLLLSARKGLAPAPEPHPKSGETNLGS